jgi:hypothetical protein
MTQDHPGPRRKDLRRVARGEPGGTGRRRRARQPEPVRLVSVVDGTGRVIHTYIDGGGLLQPGTYAATLEVREVTREQQTEAGR